VIGQAHSRVGDGWAVLRLAGEIDTACRKECLAAAREAVQSGAGEILVDLRDVTFMDSTGMSALALLLRGATRTPRVLLLEPQPVVVTSLRVSGLLDAVEVVTFGEVPPQARRLL
jgi:anti-sigma B factor antagonist